MKDFRQQIKFIFAAAALILALPGGASSPFAQAKSEAAKMPIFVKLKSIDGKMFDLAAQKGQVVLVSFGATWCTPCNEELEALADLKNEYSGKPVRFVWISVERRDQVTDGNLRAFAKLHKVNFDVLRDPTQLTYAQFSMRVRVPLVVFFDRNGNFVEPKHFGMGEPDEYKKVIRAQLDKLLAS